MGSKVSSLCLYFLLLLLLSGTGLSVHWPVTTLPGYSGDLPFNLETGYISVGPLKFNIQITTGGLPTLIYEPSTWTQTASIIFLDAPVGTGFSYANDSGAWTTTDTLAASQYNDFLRSWIDEHPDFSTNPVYIGSDSYAGMESSILAQDIINSNEGGVEPEIYLKGMVLSCPHTNTDIETNSKISFAHRMALISDAMYEPKNSCNGDYVDTSTAACTESLSAITQCIAQISITSTLDPECTFLSRKKRKKKPPEDLSDKTPEVHYALPSSTRNTNDLYCHNFPYLLSDVWGNYKSVREALHVRPGTVKEFFSLQLLVFSGDHDMVIPHNSIEYWINTLDLTVDTRLAVLGLLMVKLQGTQGGAGHSPHEYKREECFDMFHRWIHYYPL
ncbi:hypothetical protein M0R45_007512 [Rubus argutus]|uniref:Uncharacterized protein n=1 Tax=Rubus argutus TaxID=59490 RepID=A0AAW1Y1C1_RUBAR